mgnify:CR=1 FL=1
MNYEKIHKLKKSMTKELLLGLQELLPQDISIRIILSKESNKTFSCYLYNQDIGNINNPWEDSNAKDEEDFEEANIDKIKGKYLTFHTKQKLSENELKLKKELEKNYDLILNILEGYDDVLISPTKINCEGVEIFKESSQKIIKRKIK